MSGGERGPDVILICATPGQHLLAMYALMLLLCPLPVKPESTAATETTLIVSGSQGLCYLLWDHLNLHTDPRVQLLKVFENSIGNGGIPHPERANSERKEILRSVICFTVFSCVWYACVLFCFFKVAFPF